MSIKVIFRLHCTRKYISMLLKISYSLSRILLANFLPHFCNKTSQCKVQHLVGHLVYIFLNYQLTTVIFFQNRFISLLLPILKDFQNPRPFPAAGVWYPAFVKLLVLWSCNIGVLDLCSIWKKKRETLPLEVDKELKHWQKCPNVTHYLRFLQKYLPS